MINIDYMNSLSKTVPFIIIVFIILSVKFLSADSDKLNLRGGIAF